MRLTLLLTLLLTGCTPIGGQTGIFIAKDGLNTPINCINEPHLNGKPFLICYDDSDRGAW